MAVYVYRCPNCAGLIEESRSIQVGPHPAPVCHDTPMQVQIQSSLLIFGDFILGDDDFSRRWHLNGEAGRNGGKPNRSQGTTTVNQHIRKFGKTGGTPLELRNDIDPNSTVQKGMTVPGVPDTSAPEALRSSSAKGITLNDLR